MGLKLNPLTGLFDLTGEAGGVPKVADTAARLALTPTDGQVVMQLDNDYLYEYDAGTPGWVIIGGAGVILGVTSFDSTSTANGLSVVSNLLKLHAASATHPGGVSTGAQVFAGNKTFNGTIYADGDIDRSSAGTLSIGSVNASIINIGNASAVVNFNGTVNNNNVTNLNVTDQLITINDGGGAGSASGAGFEIEEAGVATGYLKTSGDRNSFLMLAPNTAGIITFTPGASGFTIDQGSHNPVTLGTANGLSLSTQQLSLALATSGTTGALSSADWTTFNNKANSNLSNLASTASSANINPDVDDTRSVGQALKRWGAVWTSWVTYSNVAGINLQNSEIYDPSGNIAINYNSKVMFGTDVNAAVDWGTRRLINSTDLKLNWDGNGLSLYTVLNANIVLSPNGTGVIEAFKNINPDTTSTLGLGSGSKKWLETWTDHVYGTSSEIDMTVSTLKDSTSVVSVDWQNRTLKDPSGTVVVNWSSLQLLNAAGSTKVDWASNGLTLSTLSNTDLTLAPNGTGNVNVSSKKITNLAAGTASGHAAEYDQVEAKIAKSTITAKGDIVVGTAVATPSVQTVGTDGYALVADSTTGTGLAYQKMNKAVTGDLDETSFTYAGGVGVATDVTGLSFANGTTRAFKAHVSVTNATDGLYQVFELMGIQKGASWDLGVNSVGDNSQVSFSITTAGQIQYTSSSTNGGIMKFRATTLSV